MKKVLFIGILLSFCCTAAMADLTVNKVKGVAEAYVVDSSQWQTVVLDMKLKDGDKIKTGADGILELTFTNGTRVWIRENSSIALAALETAQESGGLATEFNVEKGKIRSKVNKIGKGNKFSIRTPTSVASVRGTDLAVEVSEEGTTQLFVFEGNVDFNNTSGEIVSVGAGQTSVSATSGEVAAPRQMTTEEKQMGQQNWSEAKLMSAEERQQAQTAREEKKQEQQQKAETKTNEGTSAKDIMRQQMQSFVSETKTDIAIASQVTNDIRQTDVETGRTLRDIHGNIITVFEEFKTPADLKTREIVIRTKRDNYTYKGDESWTTKNKYDTFQLTITFNKELPRDINSWFSFFTGPKKEGFREESRSVVINNGIDTIKSSGNYDSVKGNVVMGPVYLNNREIITDEDVLTEAQKNISVPKETKGFEEIKDSKGKVTDITGDLWVKGEVPVWLKSDNPLEVNDRSKDILVWLKTESYVIDGSAGSVLNTNFFKDKKDPLKVNDMPYKYIQDTLGNVGLEAVVSAKTGNINDPAYRSTSNFLQGGNFDFIITPYWLIGEKELIDKIEINPLLNDEMKIRLKDVN